MTLRALGHTLTIETQNFEYQNEVLSFGSDLINYYESQRVQSTARFKKLMDKCNFETIEQFAEYPEYPQVTLFHGSGGLKFHPCIDYEGGVSDTDQEIGIILEETEVWLREEAFPKEYHDDIINFNWDIRHRLAIVFLASIWQDIKGYDYGIVTKTLENNSASQFIFNDMLWDNLSKFILFNSRDSKILNQFENDLSIEEIYKRVKGH